MKSDVLEIRVSNSKETKKIRLYSEDKTPLDFKVSNPWISVKDKMPKDLKEDWVLISVVDTTDNFRFIPFVGEYRNSIGKWGVHTIGAHDCYVEKPFEVTHWKPIDDEFNEEENNE